MIRNSFLYQPYYCEENIWQLARELSARRGAGQEAKRGEEKADVWFLINKNQSIATAQQRAVAESSFVIWDYHVVYYSPSQGVFDLDTRCPFPCSVYTYLEASFLSIASGISEDYLPCFRVLPASEYLSLFSSNREHMLDEGGHYLQPPPEWPTIGNGSNLASFTDFEDQSLGRILSLEQLISTYL